MQETDTFPADHTVEYGQAQQPYFLIMIIIIIIIITITNNNNNLSAILAAILNH